MGFHRLETVENWQSCPEDAYVICSSRVSRVSRVTGIFAVGIGNCHERDKRSDSRSKLGSV